MRKRWRMSEPPGHTGHVVVRLPPGFKNDNSSGVGSAVASTSMNARRPLAIRGTRRLLTGASKVMIATDADAPQDWAGDNCEEDFDESVHQLRASMTLSAVMMSALMLSAVHARLGGKVTCVNVTSTNATLAPGPS